MTAPRDLLVTTALPYANGDIHLGHLVEQVQADIWVRFQRLLGHHCVFLCGDDAHGTPIMLKAQKEGMTPEALIEKVHQSHTADFEAFHIKFDNFYTTHSAENRALATGIYQQLKKKGDILTKVIAAAYDPIAKMFLPDRFIRGTCPKCRAQNQYGDNCEVCGTTYSPTELIDATSVLSDTPPIEKESEHYFFNLENYQPFLKKWVSNGHLQPQVTNKLKEWFSEALRPWDISRDAPYFGFEIPDTKNKYFYVWLDAPIGYMASTKNLFQADPTKFDHYWKRGSSAELYHFIGKDIVYFHALFWPAMLQGSGYRLPTNIFVHGYLTINGEKMSKSRGTFISARHYLKTLDPEFLRYYFAAKLSLHVEDIDLNLADFAARTNSDLVGKYVNLASRCAGFINKKFAGQLGKTLDNPDLYKQFIDHSTVIKNNFASLNYNKAVREIMHLADQANRYIDHEKPWALAKVAGQDEKVQAVCTQGLNFFRLLTLFLKPILPATARNAEHFLNCAPLMWHTLEKPLLNHTINTFKPLMQRISEDALQTLIEKEDVA